MILFNIKYILNRTKLKGIYIYISLLFIFLLNILIFDKNIYILISLGEKLFIKLIPSLIIATAITNKKILYNVLKKVSCIQFYIFIISFVFAKRALTGEFSGGYNMSWGYNVLFPTLCLYSSFIIKFNIRDFVFATTMLLYIIIYGSRGPLIPIVVFFILYLFKRNILKDIKSYMYTIIICIFSFLIIFNFSSALNYFNNILIKNGVYSRTIIKFIDGSISSTSGRDTIELNMLKAIEEKPLTGWGIGGDRHVNYINGFLDSDGNHGAYAHNIFYEFLVQFGLILGSIIIIYLIYLIIKGILFNKEREIDALIILFVSVGFIPLLSSMSYLSNGEFWIMLGLLLNTRKYNYSNEKII